MEFDNKQLTHFIRKSGFSAGASGKQATRGQGHQPSSLPLVSFPSLRSRLP